MSPEELIGRVQALEWLLSLAFADGIARSPVPHSAATDFQAVVTRKGTELLVAARAHGDTPEGRQTAAFASAVVDLGARIIHAAAAATADPSGPRN